jgi:putative transposase
MNWKQLLAYITGTVDRELLLRNEYLVTENRVLRQHIEGRVRLTDAPGAESGGEAPSEGMRGSP